MIELFTSTVPCDCVTERTPANPPKKGLAGAAQSDTVPDLWPQSLWVEAGIMDAYHAGQNRVFSMLYGRITHVQPSEES